MSAKSAQIATFSTKKASAAKSPPNANSLTKTQESAKNAMKGTIFSMEHARFWLQINKSTQDAWEQMATKIVLNAPLDSSQTLKVNASQFLITAEPGTKTQVSALLAIQATLLVKVNVSWILNLSFLQPTIFANHGYKINVLLAKIEPILILMVSANLLVTTATLGIPKLASASPVTLVLSSTKEPAN